MHESNPPRKTRWPGRSDPHSIQDRGRRAASHNSFSLSPSRNESRGPSPGSVGELFGTVTKRFARSARESPTPELTAASSSPQNIQPFQSDKDLTTPTSKPNPEQSPNSGIVDPSSTNRVEHLDSKFVNDRIVNASEGLTGIGQVPTAVKDTSSVANNIPSVFATIDTFSAFLEPLKVFNSVANEIANIHPYAKAVLSIFTSASKMILDQANLDDAVSDLLFKVSNVYASVIDKKALAQMSSMIRIYTQIAKQTLMCAEFIVHYSATKSFCKRLGKHVCRDTDADIRSYSDILDGLMQQFRDQVLGDTLIILTDLAQGQDLSGLEYAASAGLDTSKCCLPGTRNELLMEIKSWIGSTEEDVPRVLWLSGTAGKGKSAIAHTIANWYNDFGGMGACFCFDRTREADRLHQKIITTIARDLADHNPILRKALGDALHDHHNLKHTADVARQWQEFVVGPIQKWNQKVVASPALVVIDALNESGNATSREQILRLLAGKLRTSSSQLTDLSNLRILITSRLLKDIHNVLGSTPNVRHISMDEISIASTERDIHLYISSKLDSLCHVFGDEHFVMLAKKSDGLFEWARLACEYIKDGTEKVGVDPISRYTAVLDGRDSSQTGTHLLDNMYRLTLTDLMPKDEEAVARFRSVMAQIIASLEPLSMTTLTAIRQHFPRERDRYTVDWVTGPMGSLLTGTADHQIPIRPLHASFYDFLTNKSRSDVFFVDTSLVQNDLAFATLRVMENGLRFNTCSLESSYLPNSAIPDLAERVKGSISAELSYSCRFWGTHVAASSFESSLAREVEAFFDGKRLLWWLEAVALMRSIGSSVVTLTSIASWFSGHAEFMHVGDSSRDTLRFVRTFATIILRSTPHLYLSALPFAPTQSRIFRKFASKFPGTPRIVAGHVENWPQMEKILPMNSDVWSVAMSPDGKRIACGLVDGAIQVWDMDTGEASFAPLQGHTGWVASVAFSPDGRRIVSGSRDKTVRVWDANTGEALGSPLRGHTSMVWSVAISPDGKRIVSGSADTTVQVWIMQTCEAFGAPLRGHTNQVRSVTISPNGRCIVSGSDDKTIRVWGMETGRALGAPFQGHDGTVYSVTISPDGKCIVSGSRDKTIRIWDMETGKIFGVPLKGHTGPVMSVAIVSDGHRIVSGSDDQTIRVWDANTSEAVGSPLQGHTKQVLSVAVSQDGSRIVSGSWDQTIRVWDANIIIDKASVTALESHAASVNSIAISPDGCSIVSGSDDTTVRVWNIETGKASLDPLQGHTDPVLSVAISSDGKDIVSGSADKSIRIWNLETGEESRVSLQGHTGHVRSVAITPNKNYIVSGSHDMTIRVWGVKTGKTYPLTGHSSWVRSVAISSDRNCIVSCSDDKRIQVWDMGTGQALHVPLEGHTHWVCSVAISLDVCRIVSGSRDKTIRVWDMGTGEPLGAPLEGHTASVHAVAISSDGNSIVSGSYDQTVRVWDMKTRKAVGSPFRGHTGSILCVAISPDGKRVVSGSEDKTIRVWDLEFLNQHQRFEAPVICFSPDLTHALHSASHFLQDSKTAAPSSPNEEGWIVGPEGRLLLWIPLNFYPVLHTPGTTLVIPNNALQLDLSGVKCGTSWHECRGK